MPRAHPTRFFTATALAWVLASWCGACRSNPSSVADAAAPAAPAAAAAPAASLSDELTPQERAEIRAAMAAPDDDAPLFPYVVEPHPQAQAVCSALHGPGIQRTAACCRAAPQPLRQAECLRMLSTAMRDGAITVQQAGVEACRIQVEQASQGCEWVGLNPATPQACTTLFAGTITAGKTCRSTLECAAPLVCHGVTPTQAGTCGPALETGARCSPPTDALAGYLRQDATLRSVCQSGVCFQGRCAAPLSTGAACQSSVPCGPGQWCKAGHCAPEPRGSAGDTCTQRAECASGLKCRGGRCQPGAPVGSACTADDACTASCVNGHCAPMCGPTAETLRRLGQHPR